MQNKSQVSIYIILGFIILVGVITLFFLQTEELEKALETETPGKAEYAGQRELRNFMDVCISDAVFHGIEIIRLQGGYIDIPSDTSTLLVKNDQNEQIVEENGVKKIIIDPSGKGNELAYWLDSDNQLFVPSQKYVEDSLADYVKKSVATCVNGFEVFKQQGYIVDTGELEVVAEFSDEVLVSINYPISFEREKVRFEDNEFIFRVPVNLKKLIDVATDIVSNEYVSNFLEYDVKNFLSLYSYSGGSKGTSLPPLTFTDASTSCKMVSWQLDEVDGLLRNNFASNFKYITVEGYGDNAPQASNEVAAGVYKSLTHDIVNSDYVNTEVDFVFDRDKNLFLDIKPRSGQVIRPHKHMGTGIKLLPLFCNIRYQFKYTLKFPVFTKITDTDGFALDVLGRTLDKERNFEFDVPIGVYLCGNQNRVCTGKPAYFYDETEIDMSAFDEYNISFPVDTMFCDEDMKLSQPMRIRVIDAYGFNPVPNVPIFYRCGSSDAECMIGVSDESGIIETNMPLCLNGELYGLMEGYGESIAPLTTETGDDLRQVDYVIEPLKELDIEMNLVNLPKFMDNYYITNGFTSNRCTGEAVSKDKETLALMVGSGGRNVMITSDYGPSTVAAVYPQNKKVKLVSGTYKFSYFIEGEATILPTNYEDIVVSMNPDGSVYTGSYIFGSYSGIKSDFGINGLKSASKILFYAPIQTVLTTFDLLMVEDIIQSDGSFYKKSTLDDDCDPLTPDREVEINVSREEILSLLRPKLE